MKAKPRPCPHRVIGPPCPSCQEKIKTELKEIKTTEKFKDKKKDKNNKSYDDEHEYEDWEDYHGYYQGD